MIIKGELTGGSWVGILHVADLVDKAKDCKWNAWFDDTEQHWKQLKVLDEKGAMTEHTRETILAMLKDGSISHIDSICK